MGRHLGLDVGAVQGFAGRGVEAVVVVEPAMVCGSSLNREHRVMGWSVGCSRAFDDKCGDLKMPLLG